MDDNTPVVMNVTGVQIVSVGREGPMVYVDTWGGSGYAMVPNEWAQLISTYDGNVTMWCSDEETAQKAVEVLQEWSSRDVYVRVACNNRTKQVCITNLHTRERVANYQTN